MISQNAIQLITAMLTITATPWAIQFILRRFRGPTTKEKAETRKINAEADHIDWQSMRDEIDRQNDLIRRLREEMYELKNAISKREAALVQENKVLQAEVSRLTRRVEGLETILHVTPLPADMKALLAEIDRKTAKREGQ